MTEPLANPAPAPALLLSDVTKTYLTRPPVTALTGVDLTVHAGERLAIVGRSGSGKSTLLNILGLLDESTSGRYEMVGADTSAMSAAARNHLRAERLGFVFQDSHVLGHRTVAENIALKLSITRTPRRARPGQITEVLECVGLGHRRDALGRLLSGGERQRVAIARAIVSDPDILLADEPTGNLDADNSAAVLDIFDALAHAGTTVIVITHDLRIAKWADRALTLDNGPVFSRRRSSSRRVGLPRRGGRLEPRRRPRRDACGSASRRLPRESGADRRSNLRVHGCERSSPSVKQQHLAAGYGRGRRLPRHLRSRRALYPGQRRPDRLSDPDR